MCVGGIIWNETQFYKFYGWFLYIDSSSFFSTRIQYKVFDLSKNILVLPLKFHLFFPLHKIHMCIIGLTEKICEYNKGDMVFNILYFLSTSSFLGCASDFHINFGWGYKLWHILLILRIFLKDSHCSQWAFWPIHSINIYDVGWNKTRALHNYFTIYLKIINIPWQSIELQIILTFHCWIICK